MTKEEKEKLYTGVELLVTVARRLPEDLPVPGIVKTYVKAIANDDIAEVSLTVFGLIHMIGSECLDVGVELDGALYDLAVFSEIMFDKYTCIEGDN